MELNRDQRKQIGQVLGGIGHVFLASVVIPYILDTFEPRYAVFGTVLALAMWALSVTLLSNRKYGPQS